MLTHTIFWGELLEVNLEAQDHLGDPITLDGTWEAVCTIVRNRLGGFEVTRKIMSIADGIALTSFDTREEIWNEGVYYFDIRLTDSDGNDHWSAPVKLTLTNRNSPNS